MSDEIQKQFQEESDQANNKYRTSGLALMTTLITLSAGAIAGILSQAVLPNLLISLFLVPILIAIAQQTCSYMAEMRNAHGRFRWANRHAGDGPDAVKKLIADSDRAIEDFEKSNWWYKRADYLCWAGVISFGVGSIVAVGVVLNRPTDVHSATVGGAISKCWNNLAQLPKKPVDTEQVIYMNACMGGLGFDLKAEALQTVLKNYREAEKNKRKGFAEASANLELDIMLTDAASYQAQRP